MKHLLFVLSLSVLAGCAGTGDKVAQVDMPAQPLPAAPTVVATEPVVVPPIQVAQPESVQEQAAGAVSLPTESNGWEQLAQRVIAWGDPLRRSMEQYCTAQVATNKP